MPTATLAPAVTAFEHFTDDDRPTINPEHRYRLENAAKDLAGMLGMPLPFTLQIEETTAHGSTFATLILAKSFGRGIGPFQARSIVEDFAAFQPGFVAMQYGPHAGRFGITLACGKDS